MYIYLLKYIDVFISIYTFIYLLFYYLYIYFVSQNGNFFCSLYMHVSFSFDSVFVAIGDANFLRLKIKNLFRSEQMIFVKIHFDQFSWQSIGNLTIESFRGKREKIFDLNKNTQFFHETLFHFFIIYSMLYRIATHTWDHNQRKNKTINLFLSFSRLFSVVTFSLYDDEEKMKQKHAARFVSSNSSMDFLCFHFIYIIGFFVVKCSQLQLSVSVFFFNILLFLIALYALSSF